MLDAISKLSKSSFHILSMQGSIIICILFFVWNWQNTGQLTSKDMLQTFWLILAMKSHFQNSTKIQCNYVEEGKEP